MEILASVQCMAVLSATGLNGFENDVVSTC